MATLEITTRIGCKNNCSYCPQDALVKAYKARSNVFEMSVDLFKRCIDKVPTSVRIDFSGMAEPWLNSECTKMVLYAHNKGFDLAVYTTLVGMELLDIELIRNIPFRIFEVHLPDSDSMTNIKVNDAYLEKLKKVGESGISGLAYMTIGKLHPIVKGVVGDIVSEHGVIDRAGNLSDFHGIVHQKRLTGLIRCKSCGNALNHNVLLPNGDVILCCMDYGMGHVLGNLATMDYGDLFASDDHRLLQKHLDDDSLDIICRYCHNARKSKWNLIPGTRILRQIRA
ncbi:MAG TPA: hypothetical protein ENN23_08775 [Deltaproteobacteria bacterium]|nr:hypothetical protein [Deltaproteobacteria bacterium]